MFCDHCGAGERYLFGERDIHGVPSIHCVTCGNLMPIWDDDHSLIGPLPEAPIPDFKVEKAEDIRKRTAATFAKTTYHCLICGSEHPRTSPTNRYCPDCKKKHNQEQRQRLATARMVA